ncbi:hypothetical protein HMI54_005541 [Coelomomyces lativittatus]|nr:hypothetical protein HMI54_005541 [Coelomomyces lativittatus]KAJ1516240.1 hypothetical protein HMI55_002711 [Coelomomyces lativittatus]
MLHSVKHSFLSWSHRLPSKKWMVSSWVLTGVSFGLYQTYQTIDMEKGKYLRLAKQELASQPWSVHSKIPKFIIFYGSPKPNIDAQRVKSFFQSYYKPILDASAIDYELIHISSPQDLHHYFVAHPPFSSSSGSSPHDTAHLLGYLTLDPTLYLTLLTSLPCPVNPNDLGLSEKKEEDLSSTSSSMRWFSWLRFLGRGPRKETPSHGSVDPEGVCTHTPSPHDSSTSWTLRPSSTVVVGCLPYQTWSIWDRLWHPFTTSSIHTYARAYTVCQYQPHPLPMEVHVEGIPPSIPPRPQGEPQEEKEKEVEEEENVEATTYASPIKTTWKVPEWMKTRVFEV